MPTIVAIGGGELKDLETFQIDRAIVKLVKKKRPRALFIPTASSDAIGYWETFQDVYGKRLDCKTDVLFLLRGKLTRQQIAKKILSADIIYVGGGNTLRMLRVWKKQGVDTLLKKAYKKEVILSGLSAGAIAWFLYGVSDSRRFMKSGKQKVALMRVSALGLLPFTISPHHIREKKLRDPGIKEMMKRTPGVAIALDDNVALLFRNGEYQILRSRPRANVRKVFRKNGKIKVTSFQDSGTLEALLMKGA